MAMGKEHLEAARKAKQDEFYTQFTVIEQEMNSYLEFDADVFRNKTVLLPCDDPETSHFTKYFAQNFDSLGLKKLISTSYAPNSKPLEIEYQPPLFEVESEKYDSSKTRDNGKIFTLSRDVTGDQKIDVEDLEWGYLEGNGDFRSPEVTSLRDECDLVITNPPFSLFRTFLAWVIEGGKEFSLVGNVNSLTYKDTFPLIRSNQMWLGMSISSGDREFGVPDSYPLDSAGWRVDDKGRKYIRVKGVRWFTNIEHGRRHQPLPLMTLEDNLKHSPYKEIRELGYQKYDNYDAIEVPRTKAIPADFKGVMGVPITFVDKYSPEQFEILGMSASAGYDAELVGIPLTQDGDSRPLIDGRNTYARIFIKHKGD